MVLSLQWTTSGGRKGKKKLIPNDGIDLIVAPGDSRSSSRGRRQGGTNRAGGCIIIVISHSNALV